MNKVFQINDCPNDLRIPRILASKYKSITKYGINTIAFKGPQTWQSVLLEIRNSESFNLFELHIQS